MKAIDSLLNIVVRQEATELRLASNRPPRLFRDHEEVPLTMPATSASALQAILGDLLSPHEDALRERGRAAFVYASAEGGDFDVDLQRRDASAADLDVRFVRRAGTTAAAAPAWAAAPAPTAPGSAGIPPSIASILDQAVALGASDVHLTDGRVPLVRVAGALRPLAGAPIPDVTALVADRGLLERVVAGRAVDLGLDVPGVGRLRVNVYAAAEGLSAAIRVLTREAPRLSDLRLPAAVQTLAQLTHGLVIVCGPTGSGKSTTLAALAQEALGARPQVLITLEDPIEYRIQAASERCLVRQREIGQHACDFATGLRDALREDPDVLLIGEMRDAETISLALTAAETGHLVLASLHSRTSASAIERIVDTYPAERQRQIRVQLADSLRAVVAQRLVPVIGGRGRVPAVELLRVTHGIANLIREGKTPQIHSAVQTGGEDGMVPLNRSLAELVRAEVIAYEDARVIASDAKALDDYLGPRR